MPKVIQYPKDIRAFIFHGVDLAWEGKEQATGNCVFCGKEGKFHAAVSSGLWDCKSCGEKGNPLTFLRKLWEVSLQQTSQHLELADERKLLYAQTLDEWGCRLSISDDEWILPAYDISGKLWNLYKYAGSPRRLLLPTPGVHEDGKAHGIFAPVIEGRPILSPKKKVVHVDEGPWDGMALYEALRSAKRGENSLSLTSNEDISLYAEADVIAVPGCNVFSERWLPLFGGKRVSLMFDSDHPKKHPKTGTEVGKQGYLGMKRVAEVLAMAEIPPESIQYLKWGPDGYEPKYPSGTDVRDIITSGEKGQPANGVLRIHNLARLLNKIETIPKDWIAGRTATAREMGSTDIDCVYCDSWPTLQLAWRKALRWTDGLDRALSVMLACIASTKSVGDALWVKIISPPSGGKSTLCEALSVARRYIFAKSTIRGFHSGYQSDRAGTEDNSLVAQIKDKTLVTKDGDTLLSSPNLAQILSEARDLYDKTARTHYRNKMGRDYSGVNMTWILCGTSSLRQLDSSELGERFLDCVIMEGIDEELEEEVLWRVANRTERIVSMESDGKLETQQAPEMVTAMQLTGGYVTYLRQNAQRLLSGVRMEDEAKLLCVRLGQFVAYMRARPSKRQDESAEREFAARLVSQMVRLSKCIAVAIGKSSTDEDVMRRVRLVALDTSRGRTLEICKRLHEAGREHGLFLGSLAHRTFESDEKSRSLLTFLRRIGSVETFIRPTTGEVTPRIRWRLTERLERLYHIIMTTKE